MRGLVVLGTKPAKGTSVGLLIAGGKGLCLVGGAVVDDWRAGIDAVTEVAGLALFLRIGGEDGGEEVAVDGLANYAAFAAFAYLVVALAMPFFLP